MNITEVRKAVGKIKASLFKKSNSVSIGILKSQFRGSGLQFKEHQVYNFGDDIRFIDWKMLAKTNHPFVKTFEEERNLEITVVLDASRSMLSGVDGISKLQACIEITCLLYLLASETNDYIHVLVTGDSLINIPKAQGDRGIVYLISILQKNGILDESGRVEIERGALKNKEITEGDIYKSMLKHIGKNREIIIFSDFVDFLSTKDLKRMIFRKSLHCFYMQTPLDESLADPISIFSFNSKFQKPHYQDVLRNEENVLDHELGKTVKKLNVGDRYLDKFIKEMI